MRDIVSRLQGHRIKLLREKHGMTQQELGELLGTDGKQMIRYEKERTDPGSEIIAALATALHTTSDYLLGLSDDDTPRMIQEDLSAEERALIVALRSGQAADAIQSFAVLSKAAK